MLMSNCEEIASRHEFNFTLLIFYCSNNIFEIIIVSNSDQIEWLVVCKNTQVCLTNKHYIADGISNKYFGSGEESEVAGFFVFSYIRMIG